MLPAILIIVLLCVVFLPQFWVRRVIKKYSVTVDELPGTGGELARHLLDRFAMDEVRLEQTKDGADHYDPETRTVRLAKAHLDGKSLAAVTIAAHEFGHALQHHTGYKPLLWRGRLAKLAAGAEKVASFILVSLPFVLLFTRAPILSALLLLAGLTVLCLPIILHLFTLPVEFDASFRRALPILDEGRYLPATAMPIARRILTAAALTYVAGSLASLLNIYRWIAILRR